VSYALRILPRAEKQLAALDSTPYELVKRKILSLPGDPRPPGCRKLKGHEGWRIRIGDYRVIYEIDDSQKTITVLVIGHRREIYR
jgi:mRNA interferase RelE/StbE